MPMTHVLRTVARVRGTMQDRSVEARLDLEPGSPKTLCWRLAIYLSGELVGTGTNYPFTPQPPLSAAIDEVRRQLAKTLAVKRQNILFLDDTTWKKLTGT